jgi:hypothetical protein
VVRIEGNHGLNTALNSYPTSVDWIVMQMHEGLIQGQLSVSAVRNGQLSRIWPPWQLNIFKVTPGLVRWRK